MKIPRLAQSYDQRDRGDWARSYCPRFPLTYDIARIESILMISPVHKPSQCMDCARTLKRLAPFLSSPTLQLSINVATIELNDAFCLQMRKSCSRQSMQMGSVHHLTPAALPSVAKGWGKKGSVSKDRAVKGASTPKKAQPHVPGLNSSLPISKGNPKTCEMQCKELRALVEVEC